MLQRIMLPVVLVPSDRGNSIFSNIGTLLLDIQCHIPEDSSHLTASMTSNLTCVLTLTSVIYYNMSG
jgi:hypothetical protein